MTALNLGCGSVHFEGWVNLDKEDFGHNTVGDIIDVHLPVDLGEFDYIFCNHMLSDFSFHDLPHVMTNIRRLLHPGGTVHILVPDILRAFQAFEESDHDWFPQGDDMPSLNERFCTFVTWFGESKSVFTPGYLLRLGEKAGFKECFQVEWGTDPHDDREKEALVVEFIR